MTDKQTLPFQSDSFTRGGQLFSHGWRMRYQNFKIVALLSLLCGALGIGLGCCLEDVSLWLIWDFYLLSYLGGKFGAVANFVKAKDGRVILMFRS